MASDPEEDFGFTYCGEDWRKLSRESRRAIAAVAQAAYEVLKREEELKRQDDEGPTR